MTIGFTGSRLDRMDHVREDAEALEQLRTHPDACLIRLDGLDPQVDDAFHLTWAPLAEAPADVPLALLGMLDGRPRFAALDAVPHGADRSSTLWGMLPFMPAEEAATYAAARSLVDWHNRHRFCAQCGAPTAVTRAGWARHCGGCGAQHFPRTDPVVIMLAECQGHVLLGRQPRFPPRFYSALAGFVEVGESLEDAVVRELYEEAGVHAHSVRYVASQPWPFPSSLMIACIAKTDSVEIALDEKELEAAMWCSRAEVAAALADAPDAPFMAPPPYAIAHTLLKHWVEN